MGLFSLKLSCSFQDCFVFFFRSDGRKSRTRTRSEAETLSSSNLMNTLNGSNFLVLYSSFLRESTGGGSA